MIDKCVCSLNAGDSVIIFPEGTRTQASMNHHFQRSAAHIALQAQATVIPIVLSCKPSALSKREAWYQIPKVRFHLEMQVGNAMVFDDFLTMEPRSIAVRHLNRYFQNYFNKNVNRN
jgi:1-acyl-sn-glycerol-3-phosphate acyltransferase